MKRRGCYRRVRLWQAAVLGLPLALQMPMAPRADEVAITPDLESLTVHHGSREIEIRRNQDTGAMVDFDYALTSRACPPYCIQPMTISAGVETIGEIELLRALQRRAQENPGTLLIDSRTQEWVSRGVIPGAVNIPWTELHPTEADPKRVAERLELDFGAVRRGPIWDFSQAKTLILYCNGPWCGQSPTNIRALLNLGYPASKLKWYRGGMQSWASLGFPRITPDGEVVY